MQALSKDTVLIISLTLFVLTLTSSIVAFVVYHQRRQHRFLFEKNQLQQQFQQELLRTQLEIQEQTLHNISEEIHDNIGQTLSLAKMNLFTLDLQKENNTVEKIDNAKDLVSKAITDLRSLSKSLNTDSILSAGLVRAIEFQLELVEKTGMFETKLKIMGEPSKLDAQKELILFRIIQESINNAIKHSKASAIAIDAEFKQNFISLSVHDNGVGFDHQVNNDGLQGGSGLQNIRHRAHLIGAEFSIQSDSEAGTKLRITVPVN